MTNSDAVAIEYILSILKDHGIEHHKSTVKPLIITTMLYGVEEGERAAIVFMNKTWREFGYCHQCGNALEDKRYKKCVACRGDDKGDTEND